MTWERNEVSFDLFSELTADPVVTARVTTPDGEIWAMGEPVEEKAGARLRVLAFHMQGFGIGPNSIGHANLRVLADVVMERMGYDELVIEGAPRTSGAGPGRTPRVLRFASRPVPAPEPGTGKR
jgi:hypothetical protein